MEKEMSGPDRQGEREDHIEAQAGAGMESNASETETQRDKQHKKHHGDHAVSRKYRMFSNYSSNNDMPHTSTSF
jgi:hypothetical protein